MDRGNPNTNPWDPSFQRDQRYDSLKSTFPSRTGWWNIQDSMYSHEEFKEALSFGVPESMAMRRRAAIEEMLPSAGDPWSRLTPQGIRDILRGGVDMEGSFRYLRSLDPDPSNASWKLSLEAVSDGFASRTCRWLQGGAEMLHVNEEVVYQCSHLDADETWATLLVDRPPLVISGFPDNNWLNLFNDYARAAFHDAVLSDGVFQNPDARASLHSALRALSARIVRPYVYIRPSPDGVEVLVRALDLHIFAWSSIFSTKTTVSRESWKERDFNTLEGTWFKIRGAVEDQPTTDREKATKAAMVTMFEETCSAMVDLLLPVAAARYRHRDRLVVREQTGKRGGRRRKKKVTPARVRHKKRIRPIRVMLDEEELRTYRVRVAGATHVMRRPSLQEARAHRTVTAHMVEAHTARVWVLEPREGEKVLGTKQYTSPKGVTSTRYCVRRPRRGCVRGEGGLLPKLVQVIPERHSTEDELRGRA